MTSKSWIRLAVIPVSVAAFAALLIIKGAAPESAVNIPPASDKDTATIVVGPLERETSLSLEATNSVTTGDPAKAEVGVEIYRNEELIHGDYKVGTRISLTKIDRISAGQKFKYQARGKNRLATQEQVVLTIHATPSTKQQSLISFTSIALAVGASVFSVIAGAMAQRRRRDVPSELPMRTANAAPAPHLQRRTGLAPSGKGVLIVFAVVTVFFGAVTIALYWEQFVSNRETWIFGLWLFLAMVGGMFVQVLRTNFRDGRGLFDVSASRLVFPLLFALIVYYPIWALAASSTDSLFSFYAAFLNGYFWESIVSAARPPQTDRI